jgi:hypothetical protein
MRKRADIDSTHSLAIVKKIGERLRATFKEDRELPVNFREQIERLCQSESEALANAAGSSRRLQPGDKAQSVTASGGSAKTKVGVERRARLSVWGGHAVRVRQR